MFLFFRPGVAMQVVSVFLILMRAVRISMVAVFCLSVLLLFSVQAQAQAQQAAADAAQIKSAAVLQFASGEVSVKSGSGDVRSQRKGSDSILKGSRLHSGDAVMTGDGMAQIRFSDAGKVAVYPNSSFEITRYVDAGDAKKDAFFSHLLKGTIRAITGKIGKRRRSNYRIATRTATLGIRGSSFVMTLREDGSLVVTTEQDGTEVCNDKGCVGLAAGERAYVQSANHPPVVISARGKVPEVELLRTVDIKTEETDDEGDPAVVKKAVRAALPAAIPVSPKTPVLTFAPGAGLDMGSLVMASAEESTTRAPLNRMLHTQLHTQERTRVQTDAYGRVKAFQKDAPGAGLLEAEEGTETPFRWVRSRGSSKADSVYLGYSSGHRDSSLGASSYAAGTPFAVFGSRTSAGEWADLIAVSGAGNAPALSANKRLYYRLSPDDQLVTRSFWTDKGAPDTRYGASVGRLDGSSMVLDLGTQTLRTEVKLWLAAHAGAPEANYTFNSDTPLDSRQAQVNITRLVCKQGCGNAAAKVVFVNTPESVAGTAGLAFRWNDPQDKGYKQIAAVAVLDQVKAPAPEPAPVTVPIPTTAQPPLQKPRQDLTAVALPAASEKTEVGSLVVASVEASTLHSPQNRGNLAQQLHTQQRTSITTDGSKKVTAIDKDAAGAGELSFSPALHGSSGQSMADYMSVGLAENVQDGSVGGTGNASMMVFMAFGNRTTPGEWADFIAVSGVPSGTHALSLDRRLYYRVSPGHTFVYGRRQSIHKQWEPGTANMDGSTLVLDMDRQEVQAEVRLFLKARGQAADNYTFEGSAAVSSQAQVSINRLVCRQGCGDAAAKIVFVNAPAAVADRAGMAFRWSDSQPGGHGEVAAVAAFDRGIAGNGGKRTATPVTTAPGTLFEPSGQNAKTYSGLGMAAAPLMKSTSAAPGWAASSDGIGIASSDGKNVTGLAVRAVDARGKPDVLLDYASAGSDAVSTQLVTGNSVNSDDFVVLGAWEMPFRATPDAAGTTDAMPYILGRFTTEAEMQSRLAATAGKTLTWSGNAASAQRVDAIRPDGSVSRSAGLFTDASIQLDTVTQNIDFAAALKMNDYGSVPGQTLRLSNGVSALKLQGNRFGGAVLCGGASACANEQNTAAQVNGFFMGKKADRAGVSLRLNSDTFGKVGGVMLLEQQ